MLLTKAYQAFRNSKSVAIYKKEKYKNNQEIPNNSKINSEKSLEQGESWNAFGLELHGKP